MKTMAFVYGWSEGPWQSRKFRSQLKENRMEVAEADEADVIVAHSSGCYLVPQTHRAEAIILIGIPFWPGRSLAKSAIINTMEGIYHHRRGGSVLWWLNKLIHNFWYIISRPIASYHVASRHKPENLPNAHNQKVILVRNKYDAFCHPDIQNFVSETKQYKMIEMPGDHEHCWLHPEKYIELIT